MDNEVAAQIETIELAMIKTSVFGFDPAILSILDNVEVSQQEIENFKSRLGPNVCAFLFGIANSAYHGGLKMGSVQHFYDAVNRLGMQYTKALIVQFALHSMAKECQKTEVIFAKNFASSLVGKIMAHGMGFTEEEARKVELACLLSGIGVLMMTLYRNHSSTGDLVLSDEFIEHYHIYLTDRMLQRFQLPDYIREMLMFNGFSLDRMDISLQSVVPLAIAAVDWSFRTMNNKLVIRSQYTSMEDRLTPSLAGIIEEKFAAAGLKQYLIVITTPAIGSKYMHRNL